MKRKPGPAKGGKGPRKAQGYSWFLPEACIRELIDCFGIVLRGEAVTRAGSRRLDEDLALAFFLWNAHVREWDGVNAATMRTELDRLKNASLALSDTISSLSTPTSVALFYAQYDAPWADAMPPRQKCKVDPRGTASNSWRLEPSRGLQEIAQELKSLVALAEAAQERAARVKGGRPPWGEMQRDLARAIYAVFLVHLPKNYGDRRRNGTSFTDKVLKKLRQLGEIQSRYPISMLSLDRALSEVDAQRDKCTRENLSAFLLSLLTKQPVPEFPPLPS